MKTVIALRHVCFEDLGIFADPLARAGYRIEYLDAGVDDFTAFDPLAADILFVLGGPVGVYETDAYPFLKDEIALIQARLAEDLPCFGICLGAQLIAAAAGARVYPSGGKEIGYSKLSLRDAGRQSCLRHVADMPVLHWHGDTFDLPEGAVHLAATDFCPHQAFAIGRNCLALQFHVEADRIERWLIGHACELAGAKCDPRVIRADAAQYGPALRAAGESLLTDWLAGLEA